METNKRKVLVVQGLHEEGIKMLENRQDVDFQVLMSDDENEICEAAKDAHAITVRTANITKKIIEEAEKLLVVSDMVLVMIQSMLIHLLQKKYL